MIKTQKSALLGATYQALGRVYEESKPLQWEGQPGLRRYWQSVNDMSHDVYHDHKSGFWSDAGLAIYMRKIGYSHPN